MFRVRAKTEEDLMKPHLAVVLALLASPANAALHLTFDLRSATKDGLAGGFEATIPYAPWESEVIVPDACAIPSEGTLTCGHIWLISDSGLLTSSDVPPYDAIGFGVNGLYGPDYPIWFYFPDGALNTPGTYDTVLLEQNRGRLSVAGVADSRPDFVAPPPAPVPEPGTWALLIGGLFAMGSVLRRPNGPAHA